MEFKILSLDFDGTLVHPRILTHELYYQYLNEFFTQKELIQKFKSFELEHVPATKPDLIYKIRNIGLLGIQERKEFLINWNKERINYIIPNLSVVKKNQLIDEVLKIDQPENLEFYLDVIPCLEYFKRQGISIYILSGNSKNYITEFLVLNKVKSLFNGIFTPDIFQIDKKELFFQYKTETSINNVLHIGDDPELDYHRAKIAGLQAIWLKRENSRYSDKSIPENDTINSLSELIQKK